MSRTTGADTLAGARPTQTIAVRAATLTAAIAAISVLHYLTDPSRVIWHEVYQHLYYVPVLVGAYWFGPWGGLLTALVTSAAYTPHIRFTWADNFPYAASQYAEIVVFYLIGLTVGLLAESQRRVTARYRDAAASLERANRELRESQEHLRRADRLSVLGEIAAGLAHEIRNPLASVKGALDIIRSRAQPGGPDAEFSAIAAKELARLEDLATEFLTYARPRPPERRATDLSHVLEHAIALLRHEADSAGVTIALERPAGLPAVYADREQIVQVVVNIVLNAIQASPREGVVRVSARRDGTHAVVEVADQGPGIAAEHVARVFEPFFTTKDHGTGLGLAVSYRIVSAHDGNIDVQSVPGSGTLLRVQLPLAHEAPHPQMAGAGV